MNFWLLQTGEPLPIKSGNRKIRTALLAEELISRGHSVTWWSSRFDHITKEWIGDDTSVEYNGISYRLLEGYGYKKNISLRRFRDHRKVAADFRKRALTEEKPDLILASTPAYDLAHEGAKYAYKREIPLIVDIRDEWPDIFLSYLPEPLRPIGRLALYKDSAMLRHTLAHADGLVSMMEEMLDWGLGKLNRSRRESDRVFYLGSRAVTVPSNTPDKLKRIEKNVGKCFIASYVGTFSANNDPSDIIKAAHLMKDEPVLFVMGGDGDMRESLEKDAAGLDNVIFTGWLNELEMAKLLSWSACGITTAPAKRSAFPNKVFVYLSFSLPLISAWHGELRDLIDKESIGLNFEPGHCEELAGCIRKFMDEKTRNRFSSNAGNIFKERFDADKIYSDYADYLEEIANER
ncbi:glycosyltransferase [Limisalsivibrio acetivorans]|uniref:glycosyltransferase n=1 Tax=Limisalsivibrio acetivorans TaxID=1304888 RepID=UPI0003B721F4|nr:glycosyltransferase [Limisalsivibrio acetivorans]